MKQRRGLLTKSTPFIYGAARPGKHFWLECFLSKTVPQSLVKTFELWDLYNECNPLRVWRTAWTLRRIIPVRRELSWRDTRHYSQWKAAPNSRRLRTGGSIVCTQCAQGNLNLDSWLVRATSLLCCSGISNESCSQGSIVKMRHWRWLVSGHRHSGFLESWSRTIH